MLLDTSGLLAVLDPREPLHGSACLLIDAAQLRLTHNYILAEFVPLAHSRGVARTDALSFMVDLVLQRNNDFAGEPTEFATFGQIVRMAQIAI